jgi:hypothetical protein
MSLLLKIEIHFPLYNLSLHWNIDDKLGVWQLGIDTRVSVIKVNVTVVKNRNSVST